MTLPAPIAPAEDGLTVVVPALNEELGIAATLAALNDALRAIDGPTEVIVVDDGSRDRTADLARAAGARVLSHPEPGGYGRALKTGIAAARYETIAITDADGTYPVAELPRMVALLTDYDMVVGARTGPLYRRKALLSPLRTAFLLLSSFVTGTWIPDPNSGLRVFRRSQVVPLLPQLPRAFSFTTTLTLILTLAGCFVAYHRIPYLKRLGRSKVRIVRDALRVGQTLVEVILVHNPLKLFLLVAALASLLSIVFFALATFGPAFVVAGAVLLATAILAFTAGLLAVVVLADRRVR